MKKIVTLGELLLRLSAPGHERFFQSPNFEATFSGSEANIACELAQLGNRASYVTAVPDNAIGEAALSEVRKYDVDLSTVIRKDGRIGIYFLETGAYRRPSNVVYDRENSCIAEALPSDFDWEAVFADASWFHISGITPAVSENAYRTTIEAIAQAKKRNITVSFDINYRAKLWRYGRRAEDAVKEIVKSADVLITNEGHIRFCLGITVPGYDTSKEGLPDEYFEKISLAVKREYPNIHTVALTRRRTYTSDVNDFSALLHDKNGTFFVSKKYHIENIVDRVGGGDAFAAGLIHGFHHFKDTQYALDFATAAASFKHTIPGDIAIFRKGELESLVEGETTGSIRR